MDMKIIIIFLINILSATVNPSERDEAINPVNMDKDTIILYDRMTWAYLREIDEVTKHLKVLHLKHGLGLNKVREKLINLRQAIERDCYMTRHPDMLAEFYERSKKKGLSTKGLKLPDADKICGRSMEQTRPQDEKRRLLKKYDFLVDLDSDEDEWIIVREYEKNKKKIFKNCDDNNYKKDGYGEVRDDYSYVMKKITENYARKIAEKREKNHLKTRKGTLEKDKGGRK